MSLLRRLVNLECRPFRHPVPPSSSAELKSSIRKKLCLPLPAAATAEEVAHGLALFKDAIARLKADQRDTGGLDAVQEYAAEIHVKYRPE